MRQLKPIRSFVKRQRHLGPAKQKIFDTMSTQYCLENTSHLISYEKIFGRIATKITLEIGCGNGETIFHLAQKYPEQDFIGIEVYKPGIANLLALLDKNPLNNIRIYHEDALIVIEQCIPDYSLDKILILFPDPWPKKRHHKRRIIQSQFIELLRTKLKPNGILNIATDCESYAKHISATLKDNQKFIASDLAPSLPFAQSRTITTKFEQRGKKQNRQIFEFWYIATST